jgi:hypothetical protein
MKKIAKVLMVMAVALMVLSAPPLTSAGVEGEEVEFECFPFNCGD